MERPETLISHSGTGVTIAGPSGPFLNPDLDGVDRSWEPRGGGVLDANGLSVPIDVVLVGHFDDRRAALCPKAEVAACRDRFVVDSVARVHGVEPPPSVIGGAPGSTTSTVADVEAIVANVAQQGPILSIVVVDPSTDLSMVEPSLTVKGDGTLVRSTVWVVRVLETDRVATYIVADGTDTIYEMNPDNRPVQVGGKTPGASAEPVGADGRDYELDCGPLGPDACAQRLPAWSPPLSRSGSSPSRSRRMRVVSGDLRRRHGCRASIDCIPLPAIELNVRRPAPRRRSGRRRSVTRTRPASSIPSSGVFLPRDASPSAVTVQRSERSKTTRSAGAPSTSPTDPARRERAPRTRRRAGRQRLDGAQRAAAVPRRPRRAATPSAVSRPLIPLAARPNSTALSTSVCGRVVGGDRVGRAVEQRRQAGRGVLRGAERRVDAQRRRVRRRRRSPRRAHGSPLGLPGPAARAGDPLVGQRQVMRRDVAGDRQAGRLGAPDELERRAGREVGEVQPGARHVAQDVARGSRCRGRPPSPRPRPASRAGPAPSRRSRRSPRRPRSGSTPRGGRRSAARARPRRRAPPAGSAPTGPATRRRRSRRRPRRPARRAPPAAPLPARP